MKTAEKGSITSLLLEVTVRICKVLLTADSPVKLAANLLQQQKKKIK